MKTPKSSNVVLPISPDQPVARPRPGRVIKSLTASVFALLLAIGSGLPQAIAAGDENVPVDETGIDVESLENEVKADTDAISGRFGKCLKGADTRCFFMRIGKTGEVDILSYVSERENQFDKDPGTEEPHCYQQAERTLLRLGQYTYAWLDVTNPDNVTNSGNWMKIVRTTDNIKVFSGDTVQLQLPAVDMEKWQELQVCQ